MQFTSCAVVFMCSAHLGPDSGDNCNDWTNADGAFSGYASAPGCTTATCAFTNNLEVCDSLLSRACMCLP